MNNGLPDKQRKINICMIVTRTFDLLDRYRENYQKDDALCFKHEGNWIKYGSAEYIDNSYKFCLGLYAMGFRKGDKIITVSSNRPEWNFADMGMSMLGIVHVPVFTSLSISEYEYIIKIIEIACPILSITIMSDVLNEIVTEQDTILELLQLPILILNEDNTVIHINKYAIHLDEGFINCLGEKIDNIRLNKNIRDGISQSTENQGGVDIVLTDNRIFHLNGYRKETNDKKILQILLFQEKTKENLLLKQLSDNVSLLSQSMLTPLINVKGYSKMLSMLGELNDQQKEYISKMSTNIENMLTHINNLLDFDKVESKKNLQLQNTDFLKIIKNVIDSLESNINQKQIEMKIDFKGNSELRIMADLYLLERAIFNLVENSIRFSERNSSVSIEIDKNERYAILRVKDSGCGISQIDIPHLFEKYYQVKIDSSLENKGGGIGLYFVKTIIDQHNGKISVTSILGKGTEFIVELPLV